MNEIVLAVAGLLLALVIGDIVTDAFHRFCYWFHDLNRDPPFRGQMNRRFLGYFERLMAFLLIGLDVPNGGPLLAAWLGAKLASNWHRGRPDGVLLQQPEGTWRTRTFIALMTGIVSIAFGALGGFIARANIPS